MQFLKKIILSTVSVFTLSAVVFLPSCAPKSSCDTLVCQNGGTCAADFCNCTTGYDGPQCQNKITDRYIGTYAGYTRPRFGQPNHLDTVDVYLSNNPLTLSLSRRRQPDVIFTGIIQNQNNSIVISDIVVDSSTTVINASLKAASTISSNKVLNLNVIEYIKGVKYSELDFNGEKINN